MTPESITYRISNTLTATFFARSDVVHLHRQCEIDGEVIETELSLPRQEMISLMRLIRAFCVQTPDTAVEHYMQFIEAADSQLPDDNG